MDKSKLAMHEKALNLARRFSVQNENDFLQEDLLEDDMEIGRPIYTQSTCQEAAMHLSHLKQLPPSCLKYQEVAADLRRRDTDTTHGSEILS